jgi:flagellar hook-associated protein 1 FlgK
VKAMSLMGSLYVGTSGLQTNQNSLNTTAHNMSNVDTKGYTRQQVLQANRIYNTISNNSTGVAQKQVGMGVNYAATRQVRDIFLDATYRQEAGRSSFYEVSYGTIEEVENLLGELDGTAFQEALNDLWTSIQELDKTPESAVTQGLFVQRSAEFLARSQSVYEGLEDYQNNLNLQLYDQVEKMNGYANKIRDLNESIRKIETAGIEHANDLRDERNEALDELSKLGNISYKEDLYGSILVSFEGTPYVTADSVYEIGMQQDEVTGFYTPFWPQNATHTTNSSGVIEYDITDAKVFSFAQEISTDLDTDVGMLKAILLARGDHRATYADMQDADYYNENIAQSVLMNIQAEFDQLVHTVTTKINETIANASDSASGYLCEDDGRPIQVFQKVANEGYVYNTLTSTWDYVPEDTSNVYNTETLYTTSNMKINATLQNNPASLGFVKEDGSMDQETASALKDIFEDENYTLNPNVVTKNNFMDYYSSLVAQVGNSGSVYKSILENQQSTVSSTDAARQQLLAVSTDEELGNMIKFQNAYNASSRYINAVSEMLEHVLQTLGQ